MSGDLSEAPTHREQSRLRLLNRLFILSGVLALFGPYLVLLGVGLLFGRDAGYLASAACALLVAGLGGWLAIFGFRCPRCSTNLLATFCLLILIFLNLMRR